MNPIAHAELGWLLALPVARTRRERVWGAVAGVLPDLDGLSLATYPWDHGDAYARWHHLLTHGLVAAVASAALAFAFGARARWRTAALAFAAFHLHLLCDLMGSGHGWPIAYLWPFTDAMTQPFSWGWELASWQNGAIAVSASLAILAVGAARGHSIVELFSTRADAVFVEVLRAWRTRLFGAAGSKPT